MIRLTTDLPTLDFAKTDDDAPASISGIAVPWAPITATVSGGQKVAFARGAFDVNQKAAKLIEGHDLTQLRGTVNALADMEEGLGFTATFRKNEGLGGCRRADSLRGLRRSVRRCRGSGIALRQRPKSHRCHKSFTC
jgi:hypothetical protein